MKTPKILVIICCILPTIVLISSCVKKADSYNAAFLISIDSIILPKNIDANTSFDILFYGIVGTNGCNHFSHFNTCKLNNDINIEVWGKFHSSSLVCPEMMVFLNGEKLNLKLEEPGNYSLKIKRKDCTYLERQIIVE
jgi:hypothetical protein